MPVLISPRRYSQKPPVGSSIDWGHPLAQQLEMCVLFNEQNGMPYDLVYNEASTVVGTPTWMPRGRNYASTAKDLWVTRPSRVLTLGTTVATGFRTAAVGAGLQHLLNTRLNAGANSPWVLGFTNANTYLYWYTVAVPQVIDGGALIAANTQYVMSGTRDYTGTAGNMYVNGISKVRTTGLLVATSASNAVAYGDHTNAVSEPFLGQAFWAYLWSRPLSAAENAWLNAEPYAFIIPAAPKVMYFDLSSAPPVSTSISTNQAVKRSAFY